MRAVYQHRSYRCGLRTTSLGPTAAGYLIHTRSPQPVFHSCHLFQFPIICHVLGRSSPVSGNRRAKADSMPAVRSRQGILILYISMHTALSIAHTAFLAFSRLPHLRRGVFAGMLLVAYALLVHVLYPKLVLQAFTTVLRNARP